MGKKRNSSGNPNSQTKTNEQKDKDKDNMMDQEIETETNTHTPHDDNSNANQNETRPPPPSVSLLSLHLDLGIPLSNLLDLWNSLSPNEKKFVLSIDVKETKKIFYQIFRKTKREQTDRNTTETFEEISMSEYVESSHSSSLTDFQKQKVSSLRSLFIDSLYSDGLVENSNPLVGNINDTTVRLLVFVMEFHLISLYYQQQIIWKLCFGIIIWSFYFDSLSDNWHFIGYLGWILWKLLSITFWVFIYLGAGKLYYAAKWQRQIIGIFTEKKGQNTEEEGEENQDETTGEKKERNNNNDDDDDDDDFDYDSSYSYSSSPFLSLCNPHPLNEISFGLLSVDIFLLSVIIFPALFWVQWKSFWIITIGIIGANAVGVGGLMEHFYRGNGKGRRKNTNKREQEEKETQIRETSTSPSPSPSPSPTPSPFFAHFLLRIRQSVLLCLFLLSFYVYLYSLTSLIIIILLFFPQFATTISSAFFFLLSFGMSLMGILHENIFSTKHNKMVFIAWIVHSGSGILFFIVWILFPNWIPLDLSFGYLDFFTWNSFRSYGILLLSVGVNFILIPKEINSLLTQIIKTMGKLIQSTGVEEIIVVGIKLGGVSAVALTMIAIQIVWKMAQSNPKDTKEKKEKVDKDFSTKTRNGNGTGYSATTDRKNEKEKQKEKDNDKEKRKE